MRKWNELLLIIIVFFIGLVSASATAGYCIYDNGYGIRFDINTNSSNAITASKVGSHTGVYKIQKYTATLSDFADESGNFSCPSTVYSKNLTTNDDTEFKYEYSFKSGSGFTAISLSSSYFDSPSSSTTPTTSNTKTVVRSCGGYNGYSVTVYSDKSLVIENSKGNNKTINNTVYYNLFKDGCPDSINIIEYNDDDGTPNYTINSTSSASSTTISRTPSSSSGSTPTSSTSGKIDTSVSDFCSQNGVLKAFQIVGYVIMGLKIVAPLIIIVLGSIDLAKAAISGDEKAITDKAWTVGKRIIAGVIIFYIPTAIHMLTQTLSGASELVSKFSACEACLNSPTKTCAAGNLVGQQSSSSGSTVSG